MDLQNINIDDFKIGKSGRAIKLFYNKEPVQFHTSTLYLPFGVKSVNKEWSDYSEYNIDCSLNQSSSETSMTFRKSIESLDKIVQELVKNNLELFNSKNETANENFTYFPILRENGNYPKLMKLQLPRDKNGNFESFLFDENKQKIKLEEDNIETHLNKGKAFKAIVECVKLWYYNGKVGSIWKVVQLKFSEKTQFKDQTQDTSVNNSTIYSQMMIEDDD